MAQRAPLEAPYQKQVGDIPRKEPEGKPHPTVGINAPRGCTDCLGFIIFIAGVVLIAVTAHTAFTLGNPLRLLLGNDYLGNICGESPIPANLTVSDWPERTLLWYPLTFDFKEKRLLITEALSLGVCVKKCPGPGEIVVPYGQVGATPPPKWYVLFNSTPTFYRCMPELFTFDCQGDLTCLENINLSNSTFASAASLGNFANNALEEIRTNFWTIYVGVGIALVLSFVWMMLLRRILTVFVKLTLFLVFLLLVGVSILFFMLRKNELEKALPNTSTADWFLAGAIGGACLAFGFLVLMYFIWRDIIIACDIIEESTRVPVDIPSLIVLPPGTLFFVIGFASFAVVLAVFIQSCGENLTLNVKTPSLFNMSNPATQSLLNGSSSLAEINASTMFAATEIHFPNWRPYAHVYNLFFFLWMFGLLNAICFMTISLCTVFWYFSTPGDDKNPPIGSVGTALCMTLRYHLGTLAFGSMLVAIVQTVRIVLLLLEKKMAEAKELGDATKCMFKMAHCCLGCLEWIVKFINKNAYIVQAIMGTNFFTSARKALNLLGSNVVAVGALTVISEYVILFGKILVTCCTIIASYFIIQAAGAASGVTGGVILLFIIGLLSFLIASLFANIFSVCIDTMLICYCYDRDTPDTNYFPSDLAKHVESMQARKQGSVDPGKNNSAKGTNAEPMKENPSLPSASHQLQHKNDAEFDL